MARVASAKTDLFEGLPKTPQLSEALHDAATEAALPDWMRWLNEEAHVRAPPPLVPSLASGGRAGNEPTAFTVSDDPDGGTAPADDVMPALMGEGTETEGQELE